MANPNNKVEKHMYNIDEGTSFPTYSILHIQNIHLRPANFLQKDSPVIIEEHIEEEKILEKSNTKYLQIHNQIHKSKTMITQTSPFSRKVN